VILTVFCVVVAACGRESGLSEERSSAASGSVREEPRQLISEDEIEVLRARGLKAPTRQIIESLRAHPELIPHSGVLGGRMGFYSDEIYVLNSRTVFARFEDGHIQGSGVFEFSIQADGNLVWRVLSSKIEGPPV
jgi:hypothetical protein